MTFPKLLVYLTLPLYVLDQIAKFWTVGHFASPPSGQFSTMDPPLIVLPQMMQFRRIGWEAISLRIPLPEFPWMLQLDSVGLAIRL